jgi:hypothetical protein
MALNALTDTLQSLELDAKSTFADDPFTSARALLGQNNLDSNDQDSGSEPTSISDNIKGYEIEAIPQNPVGVAEIETQVKGQLESLNQKIEIATVLPSYPGADAFNAQDLANIKSSMKSLTTAIIGDSNNSLLTDTSEETSGTDASSAGTSISAEFNAFLTGTSAFPTKLLSALVKVFKDLLDKLQKPEEWLEKLGKETLVDIFIEQVEGMAASLPPVAIRQGANAIKTRGEQATALAKMIEDLNRQTATEVKLAEQRKKVHQMELILDNCDRTLISTTQRIDSFTANKFIELLKSFQNDNETLENPQNDAEKQINVLKQILEPVNSFAISLNKNAENIANKLMNLIEQVNSLIQAGINKVGDIAETISNSIKKKMEEAQKILEDMQKYIVDAVKKIQDFINDVEKHIESAIADAKNVLNEGSKIAENGIKTFKKIVDKQIKKVDASIVAINNGIDKNLSDQVLKQKIQALLDKVTAQIDRKEVQDAIKATDNSIEVMSETLKNIKLEPTFEAVITKSKSLENDLRAIDITQLGTAQKTALGVSKKILEGVDVPGTVNPRLEKVFNDVLEPLNRIVAQVVGEVNKVRGQMKSFKPEELLNKFLQPHIDSFVEELNKYQPSKMLESIKSMYQGILKNLNKLDPNQLVIMLEGLHQQLAKMSQALSPGGLIKLLEVQKKIIQNRLSKLPEEVFDSIKSALSSAKKIFSGLGLDEIMDFELWKNLKEIFSLKLEKSLPLDLTKINNLVGNIDENTMGSNKKTLGVSLEGLRISINTFSQNPKNDYGEAEKELKDCWKLYSYELDKLKMINFEEKNTNFEHISKTDYYYEDLVKRLQNLYERLVNVEINLGSEKSYKLKDEYNTWLEKLENVSIRDSRNSQVAILVPQKNDLKELENALKSNNDLIKAFKRALPSQLDNQFIKPIDEILSTFKEALGKLDKTIGKIDGVIEALRGAPEAIKNKLLKKTNNIFPVLRGVANQLSETVGNVVLKASETLGSAYELVKEALELIRPTILFNTFYTSDIKTDGFQSLLEKLNAENRDPVSELLLNSLASNQKIWVATDQLTEQLTEQLKEAIVEALNQLLTTDNLYNASRFRDVELPAHGKELAAKFSSLSKDQRLRLNRIILETVYSDTLVLSMQSIFPFLMKTLEELYPEAMIQGLDETHAKIVAMVGDLPRIVAAEVQDAYQTLIDNFEKSIGTRIDAIFLELNKPLWRLQRDLGVGLEDIRDSYRRLLSAVPV